MLIGCAHVQSDHADENEGVLPSVEVNEKSVERRRGEDQNRRKSNEEECGDQRNQHTHVHTEANHLHGNTHGAHDRHITLESLQRARGAKVDKEGEEENCKSPNEDQRESRKNRNDNAFRILLVGRVGGNGYIACLLELVGGLVRSAVILKENGSLLVGF